MTSFQHIPSGPPLRVDCREGLPTTINSGQSVTLTYVLPRSQEPSGDWYGLEVYEDADYSKTATETTTVYGRFGTAGIGLILAPIPGTTFSYSFSQANDGNDTDLIGSWIMLYPHSLPQVAFGGGSSNTTAYGYSNVSICQGSATNLTWQAFDVASATLTGSDGSQIALTVSAVVNPQSRKPTFPTEDEWQYNGASLALSALVVPTAPTTYTLTAVGFGGETTTSNVNVSFIPFSVTCAANQTSVQAGQPVTLTWSSVGASYVQFSVQQPPGSKAVILDARGSAGGNPAMNPSGQGYPNFFGGGIGSYPNGWQYPADCYPSGSAVIYPQASCQITAIATSSGSCGTVQSTPISITVTYPTDASTATGIISAKGPDAAKGPTGGGGGTTTPAIPRRSCLSAPGSRYCRAEDSTGGGISFHRANGPVPKLMGGSLWEAQSSVTTKTTDSGPALFLDQRGLLYCLYSRVTPPTTPPAAPADTSKDGIYLRRSDDLGTTWPAHLDSNGTVELMAIPGGTLPAAASGGGSTLIGAITGNAKDGYKLQTCYKAAGDLIFSAPVVAVDATGAPLAVQNSGIALCRAAENAGRWILSVLLKGDTATSEFWSADSGASWTRIQTT